MIRPFPIVLAGIFGCLAANAAQVDDVARLAAMTDWTDLIIESCEPAEAEMRVLVSVRTDWLGREVVEMPVRLIRLEATQSRDVIHIDPVVMVYSDDDRRRSVSVQVGNPNRRGFDLRITAREGGQEVARPRLDQSFECRWKARQFHSEKGLNVAVVIALGPRPDAVKVSND